MSTSSKGTSPRPAIGLVSAASTFVSRQELLDCIIAYYNGTTLDISDAENRPATVARLLGLLDYAHFDGMERLAVVLLLEGKGWVGNFGMKTPPAQSRERDVRRIARKLQTNRPEFCAAVKWLCTEKPESDYVARLDRRLFGLGRIGRYPDIDRTSEKFVKYFEEHGLQHIDLHVMMLDGRLFFYAGCSHWIDLFCAFLLRECSGRCPNQMPIKLCRCCRKLFSSTRSNAEFCPGGSCQRKNFWSEERHNDYEFVRRHLKFAENCVRLQSGYSLKDLRKKVEKTKVKQRLHAIQRRWSNWRKILEMVDEIEKLEAGQKRTKV